METVNCFNVVAEEADGYGRSVGECVQGRRDLKALMVKVTRTVVPTLWYAYHKWYVRASQVVCEHFSGYV